MPRRFLACVILVAGCGGSEPPPVRETEPVACPPCEEPEPPPEVISEEPPPEEDRGPLVSAGDCDVGWLPAGTVVDVSDDETSSLMDALRAWLGPGEQRDILVETRRGIAFAKSEDDMGADPPYPTRTRAQSELACGVSARWLLDHVHDTFARQATPDFGGVTCQDNVCCFSGMEYMSRGVLIARKGDDHWVLDAYLEIAEAALGEEYVHRNRDYVARALTRERRRTCPGEPPGFE